MFPEEPFWGCLDLVREATLTSYQRQNIGHLKDFSLGAIRLAPHSGITLYNLPTLLDAKAEGFWTSKHFLILQ